MYRHSKKSRGIFFREQKLTLMIFRENASKSHHGRQGQACNITGSYGGLRISQSVFPDPKLQIPNPNHQTPTPPPPTPKTPRHQDPSRARWRDSRSSEISCLRNLENSKQNCCNFHGEKGGFLIKNLVWGHLRSSWRLSWSILGLSWIYKR